MRYDNMVSANKKKSRATADRAIKEIRWMLDAEEEVTVAKLQKSTGLSRSYFYNNLEVHDELLRAREKQNGKIFTAPEKPIFDKALTKEIETLKNHIAKQEDTISELKEQNKALTEKVARKNADIVQSILVK